MYSLLAIDTAVCTNGRVSCEGLSSPISKAMLYRLRTAAMFLEAANQVCTTGIESLVAENV